MRKHEMSSGARWMFLIGLGSQTQVHFFGSIGISELVLFVVGPLIFMRDYSRIVTDGFGRYVWLSIAVCVGCVLSGLWNHTYFIFLLKGFAAPYSVFTAAVVFYRLLRKDLMAFKWFVIGAFLSGIISIFVFQPESSTVRGGEIATGAEAVSMVVGNPLFWAGKIQGILQLPIYASYLSVPYIYAWGIPAISGMINILFSDSSGRSAALVSWLGSFFIFLAGKSRVRMRRIGKNFWLILLMLMVLLMVGKEVYVFAAKDGLLGEKAQAKIFKQTNGNTSFLKIIMGGRLEFFTAIRACIDKPIIGFGPKPFDRGGYYLGMLEKYGSAEDFEMYLRSVEGNARLGIYDRFIPAHSHLASFWLQYGIVGLVFWVYVLYLFGIYFLKYCSAIPQYFGYCTLMITSMMWHVFFSPFANRMTVSLFVCMILFARAVAKGRLCLPAQVVFEIGRKCR